MRTFEHFPKDSTCPMCGTNDDSWGFLSALDGTDDGNICEAVSIHTKCLNHDGWRYNKEHGIIYRFGE